MTMSQRWSSKHCSQSLRNVSRSPHFRQRSPESGTSSERKLANGTYGHDTDMTHSFHSPVCQCRKEYQPRKKFPSCKPFPCSSGGDHRRVEQDPRRGRKGVPARAPLAEQPPDHGPVRVQGVDHQYQSDGGVCRTADRERTPSAGRVHRQESAALPQVW
jgi:hypothetical protein